jgi:hypothetical protein|tara:strand:+ start:86 stop:289 length:204 start_codon:yes stop_codon:yes gene_type:complete
MVKFYPVSPDPYLKQDTDMAPAKFGHLNAILANIRREFPDNTAACLGGLKVGELYSTPDGTVKIVKP